MKCANCNEEIQKCPYPKCDKGGYVHKYNYSHICDLTVAGMLRATQEYEKQK